MRLKKHKAIMKQFFPFIFLTIFLLSSCEKLTIYDSYDGVPSYISIPAVELNTQTNQGSDSHKITDVWVYFDNDLQGIYPLPATFPVLLEGKQNISIKAGIKNNGIAATRVRYPFYDYFTNEIMLTKDSTTIITPTFNYIENLDFIIEDFEGAGSIFSTTNNSDTSFFQTTDTVLEGAKSGAAHLLAPDLTFEIATDEITSFPTDASPIYLELNYKCNTAFIVGIFANYPQTVTTTSIVTINAKNKWNKIYIDLTGAINNTPSATSHKVFISMRRDVNSTELAELYLDNFKIIY